MDAAFYYACLTTLAAAVFALGWLGGQRREADHWASHASRGPVRWRQADYVVFTVSAFAHCFDVRPNLGPADDAGCCCEEKPIEYRSRDQE